MTLFVAAMSASNALFAQARPSEQIADWIGPHVDMLASFGGAPKAAVCDNRKTAVTHPDRYEPGLNRSRRAFAARDGMTIQPARPGKPRDEAKVEQSALIAERRILARLRNRRFLSLADLNVAIGQLASDVNARRMKGCEASRAEPFAEIDRPALRPLPEEARASRSGSVAGSRPTITSRSTVTGTRRPSG